MTADKLRDDSLAPGRDTLEEMADKERFFNVRMSLLYKINTMIGETLNPGMRLFH